MAKSPGLRLELALEQTPRPHKARPRPELPEALPAPAAPLPPAELDAILSAIESILTYVDRRAAGELSDNFCLPDDVDPGDVLVVVSSKGLKFMRLSEVTKKVTGRRRK